MFDVVAVKLAVNVITRINVYILIQVVFSLKKIAITGIRAKSEANGLFLGPPLEKTRTETQRMSSITNILMEVCHFIVGKCVSLNNGAHKS